MDIRDSNNIQTQSIKTLPEYLLIGQHKRTDELNERIFERSEPQQPLAPNFDPRPVLSKFARFPMLDNRMPTNIPIKPNYDYSLEKTFTPPLMNVGPVSGFINNIEIESSLRNQDYALQKGNDKLIYVPSSNSDLYKVYIPSRPSTQPHPRLFEKPDYSKQTHRNVIDNAKIGNDRFHNNTRTQLKNLSNH